MVKVVRHENESDDDLLRRFKHDVGRAKIMDECRKREFFLKKSLKRKQKRDMAKRDRE
jgi:small subunit ribosomal protein S21